MQPPTSYSDGLVMSESHDLLVAATLALGGFSQSQHHLMGHAGSSSESSMSGPARGSAVSWEPSCCAGSSGALNGKNPENNKWF